MGGPGLALIAYLDSSFLSLPEIADGIIVAAVAAHPGLWWYYATAASVGSALGCQTLYYVAKKGGEAFLRRRFRGERVDRGLATFRKYGLLAIIVPSILPPPAPFKIFVLLAGAAGIGPWRFAVA